MRIFATVLYLTTCVLPTAFSAFAETVASKVKYADAETSAHELEEVSVTSIKQAPSLLRQPVSVTTIGQTEIERYGITGIKGVSDIAPNFYMPDYGSKMTSSIYVRGIGARIDQPAVGLNVDNIPYINKNSFDFDMLDIERIEVLRGPQSTLYGRNTIAGLINVYTLSPMAYQGVRIMAEAGLPGVYRGGVGLYGKLAPRLGMSLNGYASHEHGYFHNVHNGKTADGLTDYSVRWRTVWRPSARVSVENVLSGNHSRQNGYPYAAVETELIDYNDTCYYKRTSVTDGVTVRWASEHLTVSSITGLQYLNDDMMLDQDFTPRSYFTLNQRQRERSVTQDVVLRGHQGNYSWLAGVFGFYKHNTMNAPVMFMRDGIDELILPNIRGNMPPFIQLDWNDDSFLLGSDFRNRVSGVAIYHQSTYDWRRWSFALNIRFDHEHTAMSYHSQCNTSVGGSVTPPGSPVTIPFTLPANINDMGKLKQTFREFLPKVSATYNLKNSAVFISFAKGYKAGGFNTQMFSDFLKQQMQTQMKAEAMKLMGSMAGSGGGRLSGQAENTTISTATSGQKEYGVADYVSYKPEISLNYEVGGHFSCDEGRVYSTFSAFYIDVRDQQVTVFPEGESTGRMMTNAGKTRSFGAELTIHYTPTSRWQFDMAYGYTNARFRRFKDGDEDLSGNRVPYAPSNTLFLSASYRLPVKSALAEAISFCPTLRGTGPIYWDEENLYRQSFYAELGASVTVEHPRYSIEIKGYNLTNTRFDVFRYESIGHNFLQRGKPIRGSVTLRVNFDTF